MAQDFDKARGVIAKFLQSIQSPAKSIQLAQSTLEMATAVIRLRRDNTPLEIFQSLKNAYALLNTERFLDFVISNAVLRVLHIMRILKLPETHKKGKQKIINSVLSEIDEVSQELQYCYENISDQAKDYITQNQVILTASFSQTVLQFFQKASQQLKFTVIVAVGEPRRDGEIMVNELQKCGITSFLVEDTSIMSVMREVKKVIVGASAVTADGGILTHPGNLAIAAAAKEHKVPFVVLAGIYKLTPYYPTSQTSFNELLNASEIIDQETAEKCGHPAVINPRFAYIPPHFVSIIVSNIDSGAFAPQNISHLLKEKYTSDDYTQSATTSLAYDQENEDEDEEEIVNKEEECEGKQDQSNFSEFLPSLFYVQ